MRLRVIKQIALTTFREFVRTPEALFWTYGFPLLMVVVLGLAFKNASPLPLPIAVVQGESAALVSVLQQNPRLQVDVLPLAQAEAGFVRGKYLCLVSGQVDQADIQLDESRPDTELARLLVQQSLTDKAPVQINQISQPGSRYIDWLLPGLIALNLLGAGLWGIGFNLVQMRVRQTLRRLMVTPMRRSEFLLAFILSRLVLVIPESAAIMTFGVLTFGVPVQGSLVLIFLIILLSALSFSGLGLLVASRAQTTEGISGLMNLVMLPMWLLGGIFFSSERFPDYLQPLVRVLPISHANEALRQVMLSGEGLSAVAGNLWYLASFALVCFVLALRFFRWS